MEHLFIPATPRARRLLAAVLGLGWLAYVVMPFDLVPEGVLLFFGWADDAALTLGVATWVWRLLTAKDPSPQGETIDITDRQRPRR